MVREYKKNYCSYYNLNVYKKVFFSMEYSVFNRDAAEEKLEFSSFNRVYHGF